jgi:acyl-CoA reductase-like NAD-dependent aldehyde dehydrogenase
MAIKRVYIHSSIYDAFRDAMVDYVKTLKVGHGLEDNVFFGPIQNEMQYKKIRTLFDEIDKEKWRVEVGGTIDTDSTGYFVNLTIIDNPDDNSTIVSEEPFGPILPILSWDTEEEVIARANASDLGLSASGRLQFTGQ